MSRDFAELRLRLYQLCMQGKGEEEALRELLPDERDAALTLSEWKQQGLWPPPEVAACDAQEEGGTDAIAGVGPSVPQPASAPEFPSEWVERIVGLVTTTVNAAILDYHNFQSDQIEARIAALVDEKVKSAPATYQTEPASQSEGPQPPPRLGTHQGSRKHLIERAKLQGTCDRALFELFEQDRQARGFNISQMLDFILFNYYGKPKLSFEPTPPSEE